MTVQVDAKAVAWLGIEQFVHHDGHSLFGTTSGGLKSAQQAGSTQHHMVLLLVNQATMGCR